MQGTITAVVTSFLLLTGPVSIMAQRTSSYPKETFKEFRTKTGQCLIDHAAAGTLNAVLTKAMAIEAMKTEVEPTVDYVTKYVPTGYQSVSYSWPGPRTKDMTVMGQTVTIAINDEVAFGSVRTMDPAAFDRTYRTPSEEDKRILRERMAKALDTSSALAEEAHKKAGSELTTGLMDGIAFEPVSGVGDNAAWDKQSSLLIVLTGDVIFSVKVDLELDWRSNLKRAIPIAQNVLSRCP